MPENVTLTPNISRKLGRTEKLSLSLFTNWIRSNGLRFWYTSWRHFTQIVRIDPHYFELDTAVSITDNYVEIMIIHILDSILNGIARLDTMQLRTDITCVQINVLQWSYVYLLGYQYHSRSVERANSSPPGQNIRHFVDDMSTRILRE